jgi:hypothetical protein
VKSTGTSKKKFCEGISVADYTIVFFLEDSAQEALIPNVVRRLIADEGKNVSAYELRILSARGGGSIRAYKEFIKGVKKRKTPAADALIVGSDGNCNGFTKRRAQLNAAAKDVPYSTVITAIPDPHVERWYLLDNQALAAASGVPVQAIPPNAKCDKGHYKKLLKDAFAAHNLFPPLGGAEYGPRVAETMNLYDAGVSDHALRDFIEQVQSWLRQH